MCKNIGILERGVDCVSKFPVMRYNDIRHYCQLHNMNVGKIANSEAAFLPKIDMFDNQLFGMTPKEAELLDPSHRLFSQTAWEALCDAGYSKTALSGMNAGYYADITEMKHMQMIKVGSIELQYLNDEICRLC
ncbi:MAG: beta-ketoacyl synthase N-terminal-like domain-containing protein [Acutalibacteraceae bacterium]